MNNEFELQLTALLNKAQSKKQINANIKTLEKAVNSLKLVAVFSKAESKRELNAYIKQLSTQLPTLKLKGKLDEKSLKREIDKGLHNMTFKEIDALSVDGSKAKLKMQKVVADMKAYAEKTPISVNVQLKKEKLSNDLTSFLNKNTKIRESSVLLEESERIRELIDSVDDNDKIALRNATDAFSLFKSEVTATGYATKSTTDKIKGMLSHVTKIGSFFGVTSLAVNNFRKSLSTLKSNDTILTEISKTSEMTKKQLEELSDEAFKVASKYGQLSSNYLFGVQEMSRAGYENADGMAELSTKVQGAGDMTAELANQYIIATDKAYKLNGSIGALTATLDGANNITNHNAVNMTELAEGMSVVGTQAASSQMEVNEITAAIGTMVAATQKSGREMGNAFKGILMNLQQVSGDVGDGEDIIDAESLTKYEKACAELGVSLKEVKNGVVSLKEPMQILKELAEEYTKLDEADAKRANLLSAVGGKYRANALNAILENYDLYEKMLQDYADGLGSMDREAEKTAKSWEGRLNSLQNSIDSFFNTLTNKDAIMGGISFFDRLIQGVEKLTDSIGEIPVMLTAINSALVATNKDYGISQIWNKDKGKIDIQGNIFGIDITNIKNMKKHFSEAEGTIVKWNKELRAGKTDLDTFENSLVQNNAQLKAYLSTCSKDAPASLEGYQAHLKAAGVNTDTLRLKTILLNSAITMLGGWALQAAITGFYKLSQVSSNVAESAKKLGSEFIDTKSDIESYKSQIEELHNTINDSNSSIEDVTNARKTLMSVQDELIEKFGTEESVIRNVTDAINGQTGALDILTRAKWQEIKNEFNDGDFWNDVVNFFQDTDNIERMLSEYAKKNIVLPWVEYAGNMIAITDDMVAKLENIGIDIKVSTDNLQGLRDFDSLTESIVGKRGISLYIEGNAEEVYNKILALQNLTNGEDSFGNLYKNIERHANSYKDLLDEYKDFYNQYILYEKILTDDSDYANTFKEITNAAEKYNEAFISGNEEEIKEASDEYASFLSTAMATAIANGDSDVATYFENMYPTLKSIVDGWNFNVAFDSNTEDLQGKVQTVLDELKDENGRSLTAEEILGLGEENKQYHDLVSIAHSYNMSIAEMIDLLKERNLVSAMDYQRLVDLFGQENVDKLLPEDLEIAYTIKNVGNISFEDLQAEIEKTKELAEELVISSFEDAWANSFTSEKEAVKNLGDSLLDLAEKGRLTIETFNNTDSTDYFKNLGISAEEAVSKINKLVDESSQISSMSKQLSSIADALGSKGDDGFVSADTLSGFDAEVRGLDSWDRFQEVLGSTTSSYQECEEAANALATEWVNNNDFLAQLTEQNKEYYATQLKAMGIENYEEIIAYAQNLNSAKEALSQASFDLATATSEEIQALIGEEEYTELAQQQIWNLILAKQTAEGASLDTADDCQRLLNLAQNAGVTGKAIELLTELMSIYSNLAHGIYGTNAEVLKEITTRAESIKQNILNLLSDNSNEPVELKPHIKFSPKTKSDASSAGKDAAKAFTDALDKELTALDKKVEAGYIDFNEYIQARLALIENYYNQGKLSADEYYSYLEKHYDTQLSYMDKVVNAVTRRIDAELDALKQQKEDVENIYKVQIESLEKEKTLLEEANKERQRQIDLQKSLYDLERARNQRTKLIYSEDKGMHYVVDDDSIRSAQEDVDNARYDIKIAEIDKTISNLEETRDKQTNAIDEMISNLESYKNAWNDVASAYEEEQENLIAAQVLGANWEADILNSRLDVLNDFKNEYMSIQQAMADAAWKSADEQVKAAKEAEKGSSSSTYKAPKNDDTIDTSQPSKTGGGGNGSSLALLGSNRVTSLLNFKAYESGTNNAKRGLNLVGEDGTETYFDNHGHVAIVTKPTLIPMEGGEVVKNERDTKKLLDSDNLSSTNTIGLADIDGKEAEYTIKVNVETNGELPDVKDASSTKKKTITLPDGRVLIPYNAVTDTSEFGKLFMAWNKRYENVEKNVEEINKSLSQHLVIENNQQMQEEVNRFVNNNSSVVNNNRDIQQPVNNIFNITMPNVTNSTSAEALMRDLQSLNTKKFQVDWNK